MEEEPIPIRGLREPSQHGDLIVPTSTQQRIILNIFIRAAERGTGMIDEEVAQVTSMNENSRRARRSELEQLGWLKNSGYAKKTTGNRRAVVWVLTEKGGEQVGLDNYKPMMLGRSDAGLVKLDRKSQSKNLRRKARAPRRTEASFEPSPEDLALQYKRNFFQECRLLIDRSVQNFTKAKTPDVIEFGNFLGNDGLGSPGFSPFELRQLAKYLERVSAAYEANRSRSNYQPTYQPRRDI